MILSQCFDPLPQSLHNVLVLADVLDDLRLITEFRVVLESLDELVVIDEDDAKEVGEAGIRVVSFELGDCELESMGDVS